MKLSDYVIWPMAQKRFGEKRDKTLWTSSGVTEPREAMQQFIVWSNGYGWKLNETWIEIYKVSVGKMQVTVEVDLWPYFKKYLPAPEEVRWMVLGVSSGKAVGKAFEKYDNALKIAEAVKEDNDFASMYEWKDGAWIKAFSI